MELLWKIFLLVVGMLIAASILTLALWLFPAIIGWIVEKIEE